MQTSQHTTVPERLFTAAVLELTAVYAVRAA
jgi:hypothetical protein